MTIREEAEQLLAAQEAKGIAKYGSTLDDAGLDALALISHDVEERADSLHYALAARRAVQEMLDNSAMQKAVIARLEARVAELEVGQRKAKAVAATMGKAMMLRPELVPLLQGTWESLLVAVGWGDCIPDEASLK